MMPQIIETDYLVIGSGIAGLYFAANAAEHGSVLIITKKRIEDSNTFLAQAGIASVFADDDSFELHAKDTIRTGAGLCDENIVDMTVREGPDRIRDLADRFGVPFAKDSSGALDLGMEGAHSRRRVVRVDDFTGKTLVHHLRTYVEKLPNVRILENYLAVDLLSTSKYSNENACFGAFVMDRETGRIDTVVARATILATGGAGKVYLYTSNPDTAAGDGVAMAYRIGADIANMEFIQFHPTLLYHPKERGFLISEALRGEGATLKTTDGVAFMKSYHPMGELAPRDVVARAIDAELKRKGGDYVLLDATHMEKSAIKERFPNISARLMDLGIDISSEPIPVVPAAHYSCGGVVTDEWGRTRIPGLFAIGETAHTGFHGACRLASNSLLEALVFGYRAAQKVKETAITPPKRIIPWEPSPNVGRDEGVIITHNWDEIRRTMWNYVGIVRSNARLQRAKNRIDMIRDEIRRYYNLTTPNADLIELRHLALVADLIVFGARRRRESRGLHYNIDHPEANPMYARDTVLWRGTGPVAT